LVRYKRRSYIAKNTNIVRVPIEIIPDMLELLKPLKNVSVNYKNKNYSGKDILKTFSIVYFPSSDYNLNKITTIHHI
jgi:hypothetical protein